MYQHGKTVWWMPSELKIRLPYPEIPHLGIYQKKIKTLTWKDKCPLCSMHIIYNSQGYGSSLNVHQIDEWIKKIQDYTHTQ